VKRATLAVSLCLSIWSTPVLAVDWSVNSSLSETVELNSNQFLRSMLAGGTLGSYSTLTANAEARTPTSRFNFDGDISYQKYWGPGTEGIPLTEFRQQGIRARYETTGKDPADRNYAELSLRQSSTALAILSDLGFATNLQGFLDISTIRGGIERNFTPLDFVTLSARSTYSNFDPPSGGTPFTDSSAIGTWRHRLNSNLALTASSEFEWLSYNNSSNTNIMILRDVLGIDATLSPVLSFRGNAGVAYIKADQNATAISGFSPAIATASSGSVASFITDMSLTYRILKNWTLTLFGNQAVGPSSIGSLFKTTSVGATLSYTVNYRSSVSFASSVTQQTIATGSSDFLSASVGYNYQLAREWNAQLTYRYLHRTALTATTAAFTFDPISGIPIVSSNGPASSNSLMAVLTKNFSLLPPGN
jgi:hypothetical protein